MLYVVTRRPEPTADVRTALDGEVKRLGSDLSEGTKLLWQYTQIRLNGRTRDEILDEWAQQPFTSGNLAKERLNQDMDVLGTLLGENQRKARDVKQRFVSRKDFQTLKDAFASDSDAGRYLAEFQTWAEAPEEIQANVPAEVGGIKVEDIVRLLAARKNIVLEGVPGTGKTHVVKQIAKLWQGVTGRPLLGEVEEGSPAFMTMVMHPSTSYEDFIEGIRPGGGEPSGGGRFDRVEQITDSTPSRDFAVGSAFFKDVCRAAAAAKDTDVLVLLDELNRCNVSSVLGDLLLALEPSKRAHWDGDWTAEYELQLPYSKQKFFVPDNVHVIATTNTTDRSVAPLDAAIRRRFAFVRLEPDFADCGDELTADGPAAGTVSGTVKVFERLNEDVLRPCLGPDALLGHSYAYALADRLSSDATLGLDQEARQTWEYDVLPQLIDNVRSLGAEDLLHPTRSQGWLAERPEIDEPARAKATQTLNELHVFLRTLGLALVVTGTGLSRSVRIAHHVTNDDTDPEVETNAAEVETTTDGAA